MYSYEIIATILITETLTKIIDKNHWFSCWDSLAESLQVFILENLIHKLDKRIKQMFHEGWCCIIQLRNCFTWIIFSTNKEFKISLTEMVIKHLDSFVYLNINQSDWIECTWLNLMYLIESNVFFEPNVLLWIECIALNWMYCFESNVLLWLKVHFIFVLLAKSDFQWKNS